MNAQHREKLEQAERHHRENLAALRSDNTPSSQI
jgi:hypothetical protein